MLEKTNQVEPIKPAPPGVKSSASAAYRRGKSRWPLLVALLVLSLLYGLLPDRLRLVPAWALAVTVVVLVGLIVFAHTRRMHQATRLLALTATTIGTLALVTSVILLVATLPGRKSSPLDLLIEAGLIWTSNIVVFAIWYWEVDGGGPANRHSDQHETADFLFPQMTSGGPGGEHWSPEFIDYLFLAFNTSTAFSPTDTAVLSRRAKVLMMLQAVISLVVIAVLAARAINTL